MGSVLCRHEHGHCKHFPHHRVFENRTVVQKWNNKDVERVVIACLQNDDIEFAQKKLSCPSKTIIS
jgi:hypothetical protein